MIPRYELTEMSSLWSEEKKFSYFLKVELALLDVLEEFNVIPTVKSNFSQVKINVQKIHDIEKTVHHDVIAFCSSITQQVPPEAGKFFHFGCTSSDIIDTALSLQIRDSLLIEIDALKKLVNVLWKRALETKTLFTLGRSHGMWAEPMCFGFKFLSYVCEFSRRFKELEDFENSLTGKMSGAVGNYTVLSPEIEEKVLENLGLEVEVLSTQVIPRDHLVKLASLQSGIADALERMAIEIRHLHRSEVGEVIEGFKPGQKGSSTMPHKKNPISSENISGLARVIRSHEAIAHENTLLWHERDISHSSAERLWLPDSFGLTVYCLRRATQMVTDLHLDEQKITQRLSESFTSSSSAILHQLLPYFHGSRDELYSIIQTASFKAQSALEFKTILTQGLAPFHILEKNLQLDQTLDKIYGKNVTAIYARVQKKFGLTV